ncbi:GNAT family N-acetyltransferase [Kineococcus sp. T13]|nr:GNAT family N-acetyltransferase [Kineococcus vitellinus]NAZ74965.1 GNAT family N-acetyltransferase [Kineococcus vitellinus]
MRTVTEDDWELFRDLRLRMLADTPIAFMETLEQARAHDEAEWRFRARRTTLPGSSAVVAVDEASGRWVGTMSTFTDPERGVFLVSVFVDASQRGAGTADRLLTAVLERVRAEGAHAVTLHVHEDNARARAFYERRGFRDTGVRVPYALDPARSEVEMRLALDAPG